MATDEWIGEVFVSTQRPLGFRLEIGEEPSGSTTVHVSGGKAQGGELCPNCEQPFFPVFSLNMGEASLRALALWDETTLQLLVCPSCALYMKPYWTRFAPDGTIAEVSGGERDGTQLQEIESPYEARPVRTVKLADEDYPLTEETIAVYRNRTKEPGVYHQVGGVPPWGGARSLACSWCEVEMRFGGIIDYDDLNVALYEPVRQPVALIIGDSDCLHWYSCRGCRAIGFTWVA